MRFSASRTDIARHCLYWARADAETYVETTDDAQDGIERHTVFEGYLRGKPVSMRDPKFYQFKAWVEASGVQGKPMLIEQAMAFDVAARRTEFVSLTGHRAYTDHPGVMNGTADLIVDGVVIDFKTGQFAEAAKDSGQLLTLATMLFYAVPLSTVGVAIVHLRESDFVVTTHEYDEIDISAHAEWLRACLFAIPTAQPVAGAHCRQHYCQSYGLCPATTGAVDTLVQTAALTRKIARTATEITDSAHAAWQYELLRRLKAETAPLWAALAEYTARHGSIDLGDGATWGPVESKRKQVDVHAPGAYKALQGVLGEAIAVAVPPGELTLTALREACRGLSDLQGRPAAAIEREALAALEAVGAVEVKTTKRMEERKKK